MTRKAAEPSTPAHRAKTGGFPATWLALLSTSWALGGCTMRGTTDFPVAGAYFPGWLLCLFVGVLSALGMRVLFLALNIDRFITYRLCTYLSLGAIIGLISWYVFFGP